MAGMYLQNLRLNYSYLKTYSPMTANPLRLISFLGGRDGIVDQQRRCRYFIMPAFSSGTLALAKHFRDRKNVRNIVITYEK